ncbi:type II toxin-antitoxin system VapC family toxin [Spirulina sp. CS-785/01]|uniref:type II toxin-antitoxin system VapC family toxin n=1 Tax=Spirulina sp. CS-785/01 TaxID=3021716 RepID=UPI00232B651D|nr:type II toxin-antitoxin system VapC family toxin [Spirulina sp. CS-785/01]MDB9313904.1 type II toxin-antitoxin system VapC family toxin [Spirulina sp. CS-785/01]
MIILDTHIWVWWVQNDSRLTPSQHNWIDTYQARGLGVSIFSCWEVTKLVSKGRLILPASVEIWLKTALAYPGVQLLPLTVSIVVQANQLQGFHNDPADQVIVATSKVYDRPLLTADRKILNYSGCNTL